MLAAFVTFSSLKPQRVEMGNGKGMGGGGREWGMGVGVGRGGGVGGVASEDIAHVHFLGDPRGNSRGAHFELGEAGDAVRIISETGYSRRPIVL